MATNIDIQGTPISRLPREASPSGVDVSGVKSGRTVKVSLDTVATKNEVQTMRSQMSTLATKDDLSSVVSGLIPMGEALDLSDLNTKPKRNNDSYFVLDQLDDNNDAYIFRYDAELDEWINTKQVVFKDIESKVKEVGIGVNVFPDPFMEAQGDYSAYEAIHQVTVIGSPIYTKDKIILPAGSFIGIIVWQDRIGIDQHNDYINALCHVNRGKVEIQYDTKTSGSWGANDRYFLTPSSKYKGEWKSVYNEKRFVSVSNRIRIVFDNRHGVEDMIVDRFYLWTGYNVAELSLFDKYAWDANKVLRSIKADMDSIEIYANNYSPYYNDFNIANNYSSLDSTRDSFVLVRDGDNSGVTTFGFDFFINDSSFKPEEMLSFGVKNVKMSSITQVSIYCIFYNDSSELLRANLILNEGNNQRNARIPIDTSRILFRFQIAESIISQTISADDFILSNKSEINFNNKFIRESVQINTSNDAKNSIAYVDTKIGNDSNSGLTASFPLKTFNAALDKTGIDTTIYLKGDITDSLNLKRKLSQRSVALIGNSGTLNRIIKGTKLSDGELLEVGSDVYQIELDTFPTQRWYNIYQHEIPDDNTEISDTERHPLQRGKSHRCDSLKIERATSLSEVINSQDYKYYYNIEEKILYVKIKEGTSLQNNPIYIPKGVSIYGNNGTVDFKMSNIETWYGTTDLKLCHGAKIIDCANKYGNGGGGFSWDGSIGIEMIRCEASGTFTGSGTTGDGFNAHGHRVTDNNNFTKNTTATMIDCWSHDNADDGFSDHENCETTIIGGLFENNVKAGLTPAYGAHDTITNVHCRNNVNHGIALVGSTTEAEGGRGSQIQVYACLSENNKNNYFVGGDALGLDINIGKFINCISLNASSVGFLCGTNARIELINCSDSGSPMQKQGNIIVSNSHIVE